MNVKLNSDHQVDMVLEYLHQHPDFFRHHPDVFCRLDLPRQNKEGERSWLECQNEVLRASLTTLEKKEEEAHLNVDHSPNGQQAKILKLACCLLQCVNEIDLPQTALDFFKYTFSCQQGMLRLWGVKPNFSFLPFAEPLPHEIQQAISEMRGPYVGKNEGPQVAAWLNTSEEQTKAVLLSPLRKTDNSTFGMLCLASPNSKNFIGQRLNDFLSQTLSITQSAMMRLMD